MDLYLKHQQKQVLFPGMVQNMKILQMGSLELMEYLTNAIQENPMLDFPEGKTSEFPVNLSMRRADGQEYDSSQNSYYDPRDDAESADPLANVAGEDIYPQTLYAHLNDQLLTLGLSRKMLCLAKAIISSLNSAGFLDEPMEQLAQSLAASPEELEQALQQIQRLEPAGVGARSIEECLILQLERNGRDNELAKQIVNGYLEAVAKNRYAQIARELGADVKDVRYECDRIRNLNPKPGTGFASWEQPHYIIPDLLLEVYPDRLEVSLNDSYLPPLQFCTCYSELLRSTQEDEVREYLNEKAKEAKLLMRCFDQRRTTLLGCAHRIVQIQESFFRSGNGCLQPMILKDIARDLQIHESTVSRAIKDKYIQCSHGIYPLSYFFSRGLNRESDETVCTLEAKAMLKKMIDEEDKEKPLSDQKICEQMERAGCSLSRRTVAKYREELGVPPAAGRKQYR